MNGWFEKVLVRSAFRQVNEVVMLIRPQQFSFPHCESQYAIKIRPMQREDLGDVFRVDANAFGHIWRNSLDALQIAFNQAAYSTVAESDGEIIGYQISTLSPTGGHLARLAVIPDLQLKGIGSALVRDLLENFQHRGVPHVTVNTQIDNVASLTLYEKCGFVRSGEQYPVYVFETS